MDDIVNFLLQKFATARLDAIVALARLRWSIDEETRVVPVGGPTVVFASLPDGSHERIEPTPLTLGVSAEYGTLANMLVVYNRRRGCGCEPTRRRYLMI